MFLLLYLDIVVKLPATNLPILLKIKKMHCMFVFRDHESSKRIDGSLSPSKTLLGIPTHRQLF